MSVMQEGPLRAAGAHDQAHEGAGDAPYVWLHPDEER